MTGNDEKLWKEIESCLEYNEDGMYYGDSVFLHTTSIENLVDWFKNKEVDILKEFVEWQVKQYKDLYYMYEEEIKNEKDHEDYLWLCGRKAGIGEIRKSLKTAIKRFLEEHNGKQN